MPDRGRPRDVSAAEGSALCCPAGAKPHEPQATPRRRRLVHRPAPQPRQPDDPHLAADAQDTATLAARLPPRPGLRVGLAWAGNSYRAARAMAAVDCRRSLDPARLAPLAAPPGAQLISLQKDGAATLPLTDLIAEMRDIADTAALITHLDLVIAVDTAVAHLAGALGKPVWLLNRHDAEWRWLHERRDCPWYPTMRIFTQPAPCGWASVVAEISAQISGETMSFL